MTKRKPSENRMVATSNDSNDTEKETNQGNCYISPSSETTRNVAGESKIAMGDESSQIKTANCKSTPVTTSPPTLNTSEMEAVVVDGNLSDRASSNDTQNTATGSKEENDMASLSKCDNDSSLQASDTNGSNGDTDGRESKESGNESNDTDIRSETDGAPKSKLLEGIMTALGKFKTAGAICSGGRASSLPAIPGLHVKGVGDISLPLTDYHYKKILKLSAQQKQDLVDKTTTHEASFHIDPVNVSFNNRLWESALEELVRQVVTELGVQRNRVKAEFCTLLIQEVGDFLQAQLGEPEAVSAAGGGKFATLIVQLPSIFTGGAFVVSQEGMEEKHKFMLGTDTDDAAYGCHYVCHYNDCTHEMQPLESGRRLLLMYSLCYRGDSHNKPSAAQFDYRSLSSLLQKLPTNESVCLVPMEHQYKRTLLSDSDALMGADRAKQKAITTAGRGLWTTVIARAPFFIRGCDVSGADYGYYEDGSSVSTKERTWMCQSIDTRLVSRGGMLLGTSRLDEILKINDACVLIAYSTDFGNSIKLKEIYDDYARLVERTSSGVPVGSWCIPNAQTPDHQLTEFLRSPRRGPESIVIGGGIDYVRNLGFLQGAKLIPMFHFTRSALDPRILIATTAETSSSPMLPRAEIKAGRGSGRGKHASVSLMKFRPMFDKQVEQYQEDMGMLAKTIAHIRKLGGQLPPEKPSAPESSSPSAKNTTTNKAPVAITRPLAVLRNQPSENPEPEKKRRKKAHDPVDASPKVPFTARNSLASLVSRQMDEFKALKVPLTVHNSLANRQRADAHDPVDATPKVPLRARNSLHKLANLHRADASQASSVTL